MNPALHTAGFYIILLLLVRALRNAVLKDLAWQRLYGKRGTEHEQEHAGHGREDR